MTKQPADENVLKFHLAVEETNKARVGNNALVVCGARLSREFEKKIAPIGNEMKSKRKLLGKIMPELYNLENSVEKEKPVKIDLDLDLYQMEQV